MELVPDAVAAADLELVSRTLATMVQELLEDVGTLSPVQFRGLLAVRDAGSSNVTRLAADLGMLPSSASRLGDRLVAAGWLTRQASPDSGREVVLTATAAGERAVDETLDGRRAALHRVLGSMPHGDRAALMRGLRAFTEAYHATSGRAE